MALSPNWNHPKVTLDGVELEYASYAIYPQEAPYAMLIYTDLSGVGHEIIIAEPRYYAPGDIRLERYSAPAETPRRWPVGPPTHSAAR